MLSVRPLLRYRRVLTAVARHNRGYATRGRLPPRPHPGPTSSGRRYQEEEDMEDMQEELDRDVELAQFVELGKDLDGLNGEALDLGEIESPSITGPDHVAQTEDELFAQEMTPEDLLFSGERKPDEKIEFKVTEEVSSSEGNLSDPSKLPLKYPEGHIPSSEAEYAATLIHGRSIHQAWQHNSWYRIPAALVQFRSHSSKSLDLFTHFALHAASSLGIPTSGVVPLPTKRTLWTVIRSPFAYKKSQENFERKVWKRAIKAYDTHPEVIGRWVAYLKKHEMGGVGIRVVRWERVSLGVGQRMLEDVKEKLENNVASREKIRKLGEKIVKEETANAEI